MELVDVLSELLGISSTASESILVTILVLFVAMLLRILYSASKKDEDQVDIQKQLVSMAAGQQEENKRLRESYDKNVLIVERNTNAIESMGGVLIGIQKSFEDVVLELKQIVREVRGVKEDLNKHSPILNEIQQHLLKTSETTVIIKDSDNNIFASFVVSPENGHLVIRFVDHDQKTR